MGARWLISRGNLCQNVNRYVGLVCSHPQKGVLTGALQGKIRQVALSEVGGRWVWGCTLSHGIHIVAGPAYSYIWVPSSGPEWASSRGWVGTGYSISVSFEGS